MAALNKYLWLSLKDTCDIYDEAAVPPCGEYSLIAKYGGAVTMTVVSIGHHIEPGPRGDTEIVGLVLRDQRDLLWQALYEIGRWDSWFPEAVRGFVKFTRVTESVKTVRVFTEVS